MDSLKLIGEFIKIIIKKILTSTKKNGLKFVSFRQFLVKLILLKRKILKLLKKNQKLCISKLYEKTKSYMEKIFHKKSTVKTLNIFKNHKKGICSMYTLFNSLHAIFVEN